MKTCPNCGQTLADDARFCDGCGTQIPDEPSASQSFCPNCGAAIPAGTAFCPSCGTAVAQDALQPVPPPVLQPAAPPQPEPFCPNCGEKLPPNTTFCPNCGAAQSAAPAAPAGAKRKGGTGKRSRIPVIAAAAAAVVVLLVAGFFVVTRLLRTPDKAFVAYHTETFATPLLSVLESGLDTYGDGKLSTDMTVTASVNSAEIDRYLDDSSAVIKVDMDRDSLQASGDLFFMGSPVISGFFSYDKGTLGFYLPELDDTYYTMSLSDLIYTLSGDDVDLSGAKMPEISAKEWTSLAKTYLDVLYTVVNKDNVTMEKDRTFRLRELGGSCTGTVYTFQPTADDIEAMILKLADALEKDKSLRSLILKLVDADAVTDLLRADGYSGAGLEAQLDDLLLELADELRSGARSAGRSVAGSGFTWTLYVEGSEVRMIRIETKEYGQAVVYERSGNAADRCRQVLYTSSDYSGNTTIFSSEYTKKGSSYKGDVSIYSSYGDSFTLEFDMDTGKKSVLGIPYGTYEFNVPDTDVTVSLAVAKGDGGSTDHTIVLRGSEYYFDYAFSRLTLNINTTAKSSVKKPSVKAVDISGYSYAELQDLTEDLANAWLSEMYANFGSMMYGGW